MSFYELEAEKDGWLYLAHGNVDTRPHFHSATEFIFVESGEQEVVLGGESHLLKAGEGCFCPPFCVHAYPFSPTAVCYAVVSDGKYFERYFKAWGNRVPVRFFPFDDFSLLAFLFEKFQNDTPNTGNRVALNEGICAMLAHAIQKSVPLVPKKEDRQNSLVCDVLHYANTHLDGDLSLGALASRFGYCDRHLSRVLYRNLSQKWNDYVHALRCKKAHVLLQENPELSVLEIALSCGFESSNTFYRAYRAAFGISPRRKAEK